MSLTLADANRLANAAITEASKSGTAISVSICDASGRLVAHQRMDGVFADAPLFSIGKAIATVSTGHDSGDPPTAYSGYSQSPAGEVIAEGAPVIQRKGGLPIFQSGRLVGAIGVSGADEQDERCARAALALNSGS
jgi:uncharacterized protein GlcG (DUF336 family)